LQLKESIKNKDGVYDIWKISFFENQKAEADPHYEIKLSKNYFIIGFHIQRPEWFEKVDGNKDELWKFLEEEIQKFKSTKQIKERLKEAVRTPNYPIFFDMYFGKEESAEDICDYMEQFIALTYKGITKYIGKKEKPITLDFGYRS
jgi:hypothetical protein